MWGYKCAFNGKGFANACNQMSVLSRMLDKTLADCFSTTPRWKFQSSAMKIDGFSVFVSKRISPWTQLLLLCEANKSQKYLENGTCSPLKCTNLHLIWQVVYSSHISKPLARNSFRRSLFGRHVLKSHITCPCSGAMWREYDFTLLKALDT